MPLLDATIAFALCLAGLAAVITMLVEMVHRILRLRTNGQLQILQHVYSTVVEPRLREQLNAGEKSRMTAMEQWGKHLMQSPLVDSGLPRKYANALTERHDLTLGEFLGRFMATGEFERIVSNDRARAEAVLREAAQRYVEFSAALSDYFKRRAQVISIVAGIILAGAVNIDGLRIFERFMKDPSAVARMENRFNEIEKAVTALSANNVPPPAQPADVNALLQPVADARAAVADYRDSIGIPIGWNLFPYCGARDAAAIDIRCAGRSAPDGFVSAMDGLAKSAVNDKWTFARWLFIVAITGFLIGLGAPFWFDLAKKLSSLRDAVTLPSQPRSQADAPPAAALESGAGAGLDDATAATVRRLAREAAPDRPPSPVPSIDAAKAT